MLDLEPIKARHAATTPGLWGYINNQGEPPDGGWNIIVPSRETVARQAYRADAAFIAAAHADVPALVAEVEQLREACRLANEGFKVAVAFGTSPEERNRARRAIGEAEAALMSILFPLAPEQAE